MVMELCLGLDFGRIGLLLWWCDCGDGFGTMMVLKLVLGFRVWGLGLGFGVWVWCLGFRILGLGFRILGFGFRVSGFGFRI